MSLPVVDPPDSGADAREARSGEVDVAGVLLAAGTSSRYGDANKLLASVDGELMVQRSARTLLAAGLDPVVVVVGHERERVRDALAGLDVTFVENPDYESGQASSVRAGVSSLSDVDAGGQTTSSEPSVADEQSSSSPRSQAHEDADAPEDADEQSSSSPGSQARQDAAVFALGDMPYVDPESVRALVAAYEAGLGSALAAGFDGERGNPVLFDERHFGALADRDDDVGGKRVLLSADDAAVVETGDPGVRRDVDEPSDFD